MAATLFEHADQASLALRAIVSEHGPESLSRPRELANLLADLLPDAPRIARLLVTAAQDQVARDLCEHTSAGMDLATASAMVAPPSRRHRCPPNQPRSIRTRRRRGAGTRKLGRRPPPGGTLARKLARALPGEAPGQPDPAGPR
jgi:hypothetical protein